MIKKSNEFHTIEMIFCFLMNWCCLIFKYKKSRSFFEEKNRPLIFHPITKLFIPVNFSYNIQNKSNN